MSVVVVTGTGTEVGKTVAVAALRAALGAVGGMRVGICKPAQTGIAPGEPGDLAVVTALTGPADTVECVRYPDPLAPETAARVSGAGYVTLPQIVDAVAELESGNDLVVIEGAGGVLVRLAPDLTVLDIAREVGAAVLVVADGGLGTLNATELTVREISRAGLSCAGVVIGSWPDDPDLAHRCNRDDLPRITGVPIVGAIPAGVGGWSAEKFTAASAGWFDPLWLNSVQSQRSLP